jgi:hypothetical protein
VTASNSDWKEEMMKMAKILFVISVLILVSSYSDPFTTSCGEHYISHFKTAAEEYIVASRPVAR